MAVANLGHFLQSVLENNSRSGQSLFQGLTITTALEGLSFLHVVSLFISQPKPKAVSLKMSNTTGNLVGLVVQSMSEAWCKLFQKGGLPSVPMVLLPYMLVDGAKAHFVLLHRERG